MVTETLLLGGIMRDMQKAVSHNEIGRPLNSRIHDVCMNQMIIDIYVQYFPIGPKV